MLKKVFGGIMCLSAFAGAYSNATTMTRSFLSLGNGQTYDIPPSYGKSFMIDVSPRGVTVGHKKPSGMSSPLVILPVPESGTKLREALLPRSSPMSIQQKYDEYYLCSGKINLAVGLAKAIMDDKHPVIEGQDEEILYYTKSLLRLCKVEQEKIDMIDAGFWGTDLYYATDPYVSNLTNIKKIRRFEEYRSLLTQEGAKGFMILLSFRKFALERGILSTEFDDIKKYFRMALGNIGSSCDASLAAIFSDLEVIS